MAGDLTLNKIAGAVLATALGVMLIKEVSHSAIHPHKQESFAYLSAIKPDSVISTGTIEKVRLPFPQAEWVASMDAEKGAKYFKVCSTCHSVEPGPSNLTGPSLYNIVGRASGSVDGFGYSSGMAGLNVTWGFDELDLFLENPKGFVKGTSMGFAGEGKEKKRAAIIEYLRTLSDSPLPRPTPVAAEAPAEDMVEEISAPLDDAAGNDVGGDVAVDVPATVDVIENTTQSAMDDVADMAGEAGEVISDGAGDVIETITDGAEKAAEAVEDGASDLMDKAEDKAKDLMGSDE